MEKVKSKAYTMPSFTEKKIRTNIICGSVGSVDVGGPTDQPFDARLRSTTKESKVSSID